MHWFYRSFTEFYMSCTNFIGQKIKFYTATQSDEHLFPNPHTCPMLRQVNRAAIVDGVNIPELKEDRLEIEKALGVHWHLFFLSLISSLSFDLSFIYLLFLFCLIFFFCLFPFQLYLIFFSFVLPYFERTRAYKALHIPQLKQWKGINGLSLICI